MTQREMTELIEHRIAGLKCDAKGCDYTDASARLEDYRKYLNAPCPKCGAPLLTEVDLKNTLALIAMVQAVNGAGRSALTPEQMSKLTQGERARISVEMDGTGSIAFRLDAKAESRD